ncbi:MAG: hypothetical protein ACJAUN_001244 [Alcanivorax sp.]|jgi:hypothetical protein|uniref:GmrSD restriction endonuclease domain-containing protein n=1 Tax=Alcanivorax sp. TaxID=1872427 RepID=UPI0039E3FFD9
MRTAELTPTAQKIDRLIRRIDEGDIKIPAFQRGYVWNQSQVIELLESVVAEFPIGSVLLWNTEEKLKSTRNIAGYKIPERGARYPVNYALDGQQRMASIYGVFSQQTVQESDNTGYNPNPDIFEISYDFISSSFVPNGEVKNADAAIPLRSLLDVQTLIPALGGLDSKYHQRAQSLASQFLNYEVPVVTIENRNREDVGLIFERINNTGTKLGPLDLMTAWTWTDDFHLLEASNSLLGELEDKGFGGIKHKVILQIISGVIQGTTISRNILNLKGEDVRDNWGRIVDAIKKAIDFLATDLKCLHLDFLPYAQQLIPVTCFFDSIKRPTAQQISQVKQYFWKTSFSNRYTSGQSNAKMDSDIERIKEIAGGESNAFSSYEYTVTENTLINTKFSKANPLTRAFLLLMAQYHPVDLVKNQRVDLGVSLASYNRKEYHHVFPQAYLKSKSVHHDDIFCVLNFCFLSSDSNKAISRKAPSTYFEKLVPQDSFTDVLSSNVLPINKKIYQKDDYKMFIDRRASEVLSKIDELTA